MLPDRKTKQQQGALVGALNAKTSAINGYQLDAFNSSECMLPVQALRKKSCTTDGFWAIRASRT